jgi:hypothetical protein
MKQLYLTALALLLLAWLLAPLAAGPDCARQSSQHALVADGGGFPPIPHAAPVPLRADGGGFPPIPHGAPMPLIADGGGFPPIPHHSAVENRV